MVQDSPARYVPPHLRGKAASTPESPSTSTYQPPSSSSESITVRLPPRSGQPSTSASVPAPNPRDRYSEASSSPRRQSPAPSAAPSSGAGPSRLAPSPAAGAAGRRYEPPARRGASPGPGAGSVPPPPHPSSNVATGPVPAPRTVRTGGPSLHVFGDSFVGPMKLLNEDHARSITFKGASAKGLNNPNSIKQVAHELLPQLNALMAPPPYVYTPSSGRWAMLIFGNVDLQINYLWQLQHRRISHLSFPAGTSLPESLTLPSTVPEIPRTNSSTVLANATDTAPSGPALGPDLFVEQVIKAFTTWLDREIVNGPIGHTLRQNAEDKRNGVSRRIAPGKILIAAALPPLVEDDTLERIPEKYVNRLEEEHEERARKMGHESSRRNSPRKPLLALRTEDDSLSTGLSTLAVSDRPATPLSAVSGTSSRPPSIFDPASDASSSSMSTSSPPKSSAAEPGVTTINDLLRHDPPLCTLEVRVAMTNKYNSLLADYCRSHPDIFALVDISTRMREKDISSGWKGSTVGQVDRGTWACPVDPTNIHPLWEVTLPLWLEALGEEGVPVEGFKISQNAEETFKAYELDKRRRVAEGDAYGAVKIRDE